MKTLTKSYKTSIASIIGATLIYLQAKGIIWKDEAIYLPYLLAAWWLSVNLVTNRQWGWKK